MLIKYEIDNKELRNLVYGQICDLDDQVDEIEINDTTTSKKVHIGTTAMPYEMDAFKCSDGRVVGHFITSDPKFHIIVNFDFYAFTYATLADFITSYIKENYFG